jgi:nicotinamidase-related amidase
MGRRDPGLSKMAAKRIVASRCCGAIIDVQEFFISQAGKGRRAKIKTNTKNFARLLGYFRIPMIVTLERPLARKGGVPPEIKRDLGPQASIFEKDFFDLTKDSRIRKHLAGLKKKQIVITGCETDVCVLQSCLGLLSLGYEVFVVDDLIFSSSRNVDSAIARMKAEGAVLLTYKSLYYELIEAVDGGPHDRKLVKTFGYMPDDIPDVTR